jgi:hypothetical protein
MRLIIYSLTGIHTLLSALEEFRQTPVSTPHIRDQAYLLRDAISGKMYDTIRDRTKSILNQVALSPGTRWRYVRWLEWGITRQFSIRARLVRHFADRLWKDSSFRYPSYDDASGAYVWSYHRYRESSWKFETLHSVRLRK